MLEVWPVATLKVTSSYGMRDLDGDGTKTLHAGTDFRAAVGAVLYAMGNGIVRAAGQGACGNGGGLGIDIVDDDDGRLVYCHASRVDVVAGQRVTAGQAIGLAGATGAVTGPHLHLQWQPAYPQSTATADIEPILAGLRSPVAAAGGSSVAGLVFGAGLAGAAWWTFFRKKKNRGGKR